MYHDLFCNNKAARVSTRKYGIIYINTSNDDEDLLPLYESI